MRQNKLKERLTSKQVSYGVITPTTDPIICEYLGLLGLDFYIIDGEHGAIGSADALAMVRACETVGLTPLARVRSNDPKLILQYLDAGVMGIMMPGTDGPDDCNKLVEAIKYPPMGKRGLGPVRAANYMAGALSQKEYIELSNQQTLVLPMIETIECIKNLDKLVAIEGVDGFIIGPRDLALSMGFFDGPMHPEVTTIIDHAIKTVCEAGKYVGTVAATADQAKQLSDKGVQLLLNSVQGLLTSSVKGFLRDR